MTRIEKIHKEYSTVRRIQSIASKLVVHPTPIHVDVCTSWAIYFIGKQTKIKLQSEKTKPKIVFRVWRSAENSPAE